MTDTNQNEESVGSAGSVPDDPAEEINQHLIDLENNDFQIRLAAVKALAELEASDVEILHLLERVAGQDERQAVREAALQALQTTVYQTLQYRSNRLTAPSRQIILTEIERWTTDGLIGEQTAQLLTQRYHLIEPPAQKEIEAKPDEPRPSLLELLLSETTIKVALYLGAFFVVAAAFILAAIFEAARLPILGMATLGFLGAAVGLKWRLPQASFVLFIVFSFLLPIDTTVLFDFLDLSADTAELAWIFVTFALALIWIGGTLFYASRFFSVVALVTLSITAVQIGRWFDLTPHLDVLLLEVSALVALAGAWALGLWQDKEAERWWDKKFALPLFGWTQLLQLGVLGLSAIFIFIAFVDEDLPANGWWLAIALTWFLAAIFYAASHKLTSFALFPLLVVVALIPAPLLFSGAFEPSILTFAILACVWGVALALAGEGVSRVQMPTLRLYAPYLIGGSALVFGLATISGLSDRVVTGLAILIVTTLVYLGMTLLQPRWWLWAGTLLAGTAAYFTLFFLPSLEAYDFYPGFVLLWPSLALLTINLVARLRFAASKFWHLPPLVLGIIYGGATVLVLLVSGVEDEPGRATIAFLIIAAFTTLFSLLDHKPLVGYGATITLALAVVFSLVYFDQERWIAPLITLAGLYFAGGLALTQLWSASPDHAPTDTPAPPPPDPDQNVSPSPQNGLSLPSQWGTVLRWSGLALGVLVSITAPGQGGAAAVIGTALAATFFAIEAYRQKNIWLGFPATFLYLGSYFILLVELDISQPQVYSIGAALLGFIMHYLLVRSRSNWAAFFTGLISQLILLGTTYIQMVDTEQLLFFFVLFAQSLVVLTYGLVVRSKSLTIAPVFFVVVGVITVALSVLAGIPALILVGCSGLLLLLLGTVALIKREQLLALTNRLGERLGGWQA